MTQSRRERVHCQQTAQAVCDLADFGIAQLRYGREEVARAMGAFGERLAQYRKRVGLSQSQLAKRVGLTPSHVSRIEKGVRTPPRSPKLVRIVDVLRLHGAEAEEFVRLAGHDPLILGSAEALAYDSPLVENPSWRRLLLELERLSPRQQECCIDAFITLLTTLTGLEEGSPAEEEVKEDRPSCPSPPPSR